MKISKEAANEVRMHLRELFGIDLSEGQALRMLKEGTEAGWIKVVDLSDKDTDNEDK